MNQSTRTNRTKRPDVPKRAAIYVRVSSEEQVEGYSLSAQERAARAYCEAHGWELVLTYADEGKSAWTDDVAKRPEFSRMLADAEAGAFDVLIVHKLDRFARNVRLCLETLHELESHGVAFVSLSESMDFSTPIGRVILSTLAAFAEYYSHNLSAETKKGKAERKRQGLYNGLVPFGMMRRGEDRVPVADPETLPGLLLAFNAAAAGKSDRKVAEELNAAGYRSTGNRGRNPFTRDTVRPILQNRFYLGELPDGEGGWIEGQHEPVISDELFNSAQESRRANRGAHAKVKRAARVYSLSGSARCVLCGGAVHFSTGKDGARCFCYAARGSNACERKSARVEAIDRQIAEYVGRLGISDAQAREVADRYRHTMPRGELDIARERKELTGRLARLKELYGWGDLTREEYQAQRAELELKLAALVSPVDRESSITKARELLRDLGGAWELATPAQRNKMARLLFDRVEIDLSAERVAAVVPTADFAPFMVLEFEAREEKRTGERQLTGPSCGSDGIRTRDLSLDRAAC